MTWSSLAVEVVADYRRWGGTWVVSGAVGLWHWAEQGKVTLRGAAMLAWLMIWLPLAWSWHGRPQSTIGDEWERWRRARRRKRGTGCLALLGAGVLLWPSPLDPGVIPGWAMLGSFVLFL